MPVLEREGAAIHWEERGEGPGVFVAHSSLVSMPSNLAGLIGDLATDHRVLTCDPRGTGESSRSGPYDIATDAADLAAVIEEAAAGPVVTVSAGYNPVPLALSESRPDLTAAVVLCGALPRIGAHRIEDLPLDESESVVDVMFTMAESDPRGLLRTLIAMGNPQLSEAEVRDRLEAQLAYCPPEVAIPRGKSHQEFDVGDACAALGDRLWIVHWANVFSTPAALARVGEMLPAAHPRPVEDGPLSRPELTAGVVREAVAGSAAARAGRQGPSGPRRGRVASSGGTPGHQSR